MPEAPDATPRWRGQTYYGRPQLKPAPFDKTLVGTYVFLAGLSGAAQILSTILDLTRGPEAAATVRRGRYLSLLAPTVGSVCLILDLHTPKRFYNMLRVAKWTSPMSIGSWILVAFSGTSALSTGLHTVADHVRPRPWLGSFARAVQLPASVLGAGMCSYTAALFSATSSPRWAASPVNLAIRFSAAAIASGAAALGLGEGRNRTGRALDLVAVTALATELAAVLGSEQDNRRLGITPPETPPMDIASVLLPLGLLSTSLLLSRRRSRPLTTIADLAILAGSWAMRMNVIREGQDSASRPETSLRFAQPENLPKIRRASDQRSRNFIPG
jgi:hypothetical protein